MTIIAAADGSALSNPGPAGWAWVVNESCWAAGGWPNGTNNQGELTAVLELLQATAEAGLAGEPLLIQCDSQYVINSLTKWRFGWKKKGWKKADGKPVLNVEIMQALDAALANRQVEFEWVKGHAGHPLNELADEKARNAATAYQQKRQPNEGPGWTLGKNGDAKPEKPSGNVPATEAPAPATEVPAPVAKEKAPATEAKAAKAPADQNRTATSEPSPQAALWEADALDFSDPTSWGETTDAPINGEQKANGNEPSEATTSVAPASEPVAAAAQTAPAPDSSANEPGAFQAQTTPAQGSSTDEETVPEVEQLRREMEEFVIERNWQRFQDPKSILLAMMGEVGELAECFQWLPADQAAALAKEGERAEAIRDEVADVFLYLLQLCSVCDIDLAAATRAKAVKNAKKYPAAETAAAAGPIGPEGDNFASQGTKLAPRHTD
nr:RNase H family protein [Boudabousia tangfeifanii]